MLKTGVITPRCWKFPNNQSIHWTLTSIKSPVCSKQSSYLQLLLLFSSFTLWFSFWVVINKHFFTVCPSFIFNVPPPSPIASGCTRHNNTPLTGSEWATTLNEEHKPKKITGFPYSNFHFSTLRSAERFKYNITFQCQLFSSPVSSRHYIIPYR